MTAQRARAGGGQHAEKTCVPSWRRSVDLRPLYCFGIEGMEWIAQTPEGRSEAAARDAEERAAAQADAEREQHRQERRARERVAIDLLRGSTKSNGTSSS